MPRWRLPENFSDSLPSEARAIEDLRRNLLDLYRCYGYELVSPPLIEYLDSLLTGTASDLDLQTFKLVDQLSGRTLALRSDMTPQVARIDAHLLNRQGIARLCYVGSVAHTRPRGFFSNREPIQIGAELYGHAGLEADIEVIELMLSSLKAAGAEHVRVDLSHHAIVAELLKSVNGVDEDTLFALLQAKDVPSLEALLSKDFPQQVGAWIALTDLYGTVTASINAAPSNVLQQARKLLPNTKGIQKALLELEQLTQAAQLLRFEGVTLAIDLADVRSYRYHNGVTFSAWVAEAPDAIARGGRYDNIGEAFGRPRPATGFSLELREMARLWSDGSGAVSRAISAPWSDDPILAQEVAKLRVAGEIVVQVLPGHGHEQQEFVFDRELKLINGEWVVAPR
jgi:ATP phosphoribosyltransferase regulatory subunit